MDTDLKLVRLTDYVAAYALVHEPSIWPHVHEDGIIDYVPDVLNEVWVAVVLENVGIIGAYRLHRTSSVTYMIHALLIKEYRQQYSLEAAKAVISWVRVHLPMCAKLECTIPSKYVNVINHVLKVGFYHEGTRRSSYTKSGRVWDIELFGMTAKEMEEV